MTIHDGSDGAGHYFVYIKDHQNGTYKKFNDTIITESDFTQMYNDS